jgi:hypothetical protein
MSDVHSEVDLGTRRNRSRMTNGSQLLPGVDGRSPWARRCRDLITLHVNDKGGPDNVSEAERAIVRRVAVLITELERMEATFALSEGAPDAATLDLYQRTANSLRRLLESIGLQRRSRDITPTLAEVIAKATAAPGKAVGSFSGGVGSETAGAAKATQRPPHESGEAMS